MNGIFEITILRVQRAVVVDILGVESAAPVGVIVVPLGSIDMRVIRRGSVRIVVPVIAVRIGVFRGCAFGPVKFPFKAGILGIGFKFSYHSASELLAIFAVKMLVVVDIL